MAHQKYSAFIGKAGVELPARRLIFLAGAILLIAGAVVFRAQITGAEVPGEGYVDGLSLEDGAGDGTRKAVISGWAGSLRPGVGLTSVSVYFGAEEVYAGLTETWERPDVVKAMSRPEWLNSGWRVAVPIPENLEKGRYPVRVRAQLEDGEEFDLMNVKSAQEIEIPSDGWRPPGVGFGDVQKTVRQSQKRLDLASLKFTLQTASPHGCQFSNHFSETDEMLKGKTALVTGSTSGIGLGVASAFAAQGCNIALNGFGEPARNPKDSRQPV